MIKARHHSLYDCFFNRYIHHILKKDFHHINVVGEWPIDKNSQLIIGNHVSWWDGFWAYYLNKRFLNKHFYAMMLETQLKPRLFLSRIGGFSINPGNRSVVESLNYAVNVLQHPSNVVVMYPQGRIASFSAGVLPFQKGVNEIVWKSQLNQVLFYVALVDYFSERKPTLTFHLGSYNVNSDVNLETAFRLFYDSAVLKQTLVLPR
jgi:hypothetical protein